MAAAAAPLALLALSLGAGLEVEAPKECVVADDVDEAVREVGGIDEIAETVTVDVRGGGAPDDEGRERYSLRVHIELVDVPPLTRELAIRPVECGDVPALVAVLVREQRRARKPKLPLPPQEPRELSRHGDTSRTLVSGCDPCATGTCCGGGPDADGCGNFSICAGPCGDVVRDVTSTFAFCGGIGGPPDWGGSFVSISVGSAFVLSYVLEKPNELAGARLALDYSLVRPDDVGFTVAADLIVSQATGLALTLGGGAVWATNVKRVGDEITLSLRATLAAGVRGRGTTDVATPIALADPVDKPPDVTVGAPAPELHLLLLPEIAGRVRLGWAYVEIGGFVEVMGPLPAPGVFLSLGFNI